MRDKQIKPENTDSHSVSLSNLLCCVNDLLDTVYKLHPHGTTLRKRDDEDLRKRLTLLGENVFDPKKTVRRILVARELIRKAKNIIIMEE